MTNSSPRESKREEEEEEEEDNKSKHGQDNQSFVADNSPEETVSIDPDNVRVAFRRDSIAVEVDQRQDSAATLGINENEQSPYEEVAANVSNKDDPSIPALTFRSWFLGITFTAAIAFVNQFFWYRTSPLVIGVLVAQLLSHLAGKTLEKILPKKKFKIFRWTFSLNPGPFTVKEHCIITTMASTGVVSFECVPA